jgi:hypothetical protein
MKETSTINVTTCSDLLDKLIDNFKKITAQIKILEQF